MLRKRHNQSERQREKDGERDRAEAEIKRETVIGLRIDKQRQTEADRLSEFVQIQYFCNLSLWPCSCFSLINEYRMIE